MFQTALRSARCQSLWGLGSVALALVTLALAAPVPAALANHAPGHGGSPVAAAFEAAAQAREDPFPAEALSAAAKPGCPALLDYRMEDLRGRRIDLCAFRGKVLLVVNTASRCGYTPRYEGLQALYGRLRARGLVVLGFPANDFGGQEPGSNKDIEEFCTANYGVTFPMFGKVTVLGAGKTPFYRALTQGAAPAVAPGEIAWNFEKFLVGRDGRLLARYRTRVTPEAPELLAALEHALGG